MRKSPRHPKINDLEWTHQPSKQVEGCALGLASRKASGSWFDPVADGEENKEEILAHLLAE